MKYYSVEEILEEIDSRFAYDFEGRKKDQNLITKKTWNKYHDMYFEDLEDKWIKTLPEDELDNLDDMIEKEKQRRVKSGNRYKKYREDLVNDIIDFNIEKLIKHLNSGRTVELEVDPRESFIDLAKVLNVRFDRGYGRTQYFKEELQERRSGGIPEITPEEKRNQEEELLNIIFDQLIDKKKFDDDVLQLLFSNDLLYGKSESREDQVESLGVKIDAKNYLKETIQRDLANKIT